jgi:hypothetical protein
MPRLDVVVACFGLTTVGGVAGVASSRHRAVSIVHARVRRCVAVVEGIAIVGRRRRRAEAARTTVRVDGAVASGQADICGGIGRRGTTIARRRGRTVRIVEALVVGARQGGRQRAGTAAIRPRIAFRIRIASAGELAERRLGTACPTQHRARWAGGPVVDGGLHPPFGARIFGPRAIASLRGRASLGSGVPAPTSGWARGEDHDHPTNRPTHRHGEPTSTIHARRDAHVRRRCEGTRAPAVDVHREPRPRAETESRDREPRPRTRLETR